MGWKRRHRRQLERERTQTAGMTSEPASTSGVGAIGVESLPVEDDMPILPFGASGDPPPAPTPSLLARARRGAATAAGLALGAMLGGPVGAVVGGGVGAAIDWARG